MPAGPHAWIRNNILGLVAIFIALSGSAAAATVVIQHDSNGSAKASKKKQKAKAGPPGPAGPAGAPGGLGPTGPSNGYSTGFTDDVTMTSAGEFHTLMSLSVPSGDYIVIARLQGETGDDGGGNDFRYDCRLDGPAGAIDDPIYRAGQTDGVEQYLTYEGAYTGGGGTITLTCSSENSHTLFARSGSMVAIKLGDLN